MTARGRVARPQVAQGHLRSCPPSPDVGQVYPSRRHCLMPGAPDWADIRTPDRLINPSHAGRLELCRAGSRSALAPTVAAGPGIRRSTSELGGAGVCLDLEPPPPLAWQGLARKIGHLIIWRLGDSIWFHVAWAFLPRGHMGKRSASASSSARLRAAKIPRCGHLPDQLTSAERRWLEELERPAPHDQRAVDVYGATGGDDVQVGRAAPVGAGLIGVGIAEGYVHSRELFVLQQVAA